MPKNELPVIATVKEAYALFFGEFIALLRAAWAPVILMLVLSAFASQLIAATNSSGHILGALLLVLASLVSILAVVRWHRFVILGETERDRPIFAIRREERASILAYVVVSLLFVATFLPLLATIAASSMDRSSAGDSSFSITAIAFVVIGIAVSIAIFFFAIRLSLILPHAAVTGHVGLRAIYSATRGNIWRMLCIYLLTMLPLMMLAIVPEFLARAGADMEGPAPVTAISAWLNAAVTILFQLMSAIGLSLVYIRLVDLPGATRQAQSLTS